MQLAWVVLAIIAGGFLGFLLGKSIFERRNRELSADLAEAKNALAKARTESESRASFEALATERQGAIDRLENERIALREELRVKSETDRDQAARISRLEAELNNERQNLAEKLALLETAKKALSDQFQALAAEVLEAKSKTFSEASQTQLGTLLEPLKTQIGEFREKVEEAQKDSLVGRTELASELKQLRSLNENLSSEAHSLSTALRQDTQKQGHWGEQILLLILEKSGYLQKGIHYTYQEPFFIEDEETGQKRKQQTDVIVKLPEGRHLIIDCKVTLNAYRDYENAINDNERNTALDRLLKSFREHYKGLAERNYQRLPRLQSPDFVVMFAPLEPAFMLAIQKDESLWMDAYQKGVLLAGPTTVLFIVRIVENLWRQEQQAKNVQKVIDRGEKLYEKFVGFAEDLEAVGSKIGEADSSYKEALKKLTFGPGSLVRQVEMLRELGLTPKKKLKPKLLEAAGIDEPEIVPGLALAAEAEESAESE
ncbi:MAG: DNA recombination protein RmuC [Terracidiphilus sp.]|jgi:DNA recombination protein RmuC